MGKQSITVELDDETVRFLAGHGRPIDVLAHLAHSAAEGERVPGHPGRHQTDASLRLERSTADSANAQRSEADEAEVNTSLRVSRERADQVTKDSREHAARGGRLNVSDSERARGLLEHERSRFDASLEHERAERSRGRKDTLTTERDTTDRNLSGERTHADTLIVDQREANERMVSAAIRAQELTDEAESAKQRAEESERELLEVAEFRELFIGILGHDLRTPLGSIVVAAGSMLRRGHLDDQDAQTAARIIRSSHRMTRMISQLLDLARARLGGGMPIAPTPTDLRELCQSVIEEFDRKIQLQLEADMTGDWDEDRLAAVLSNLVGNAVEHAEPATSVLVKAYPDGAEVVVEVSNQGDPIPADVRPFMFEPFRRGKQHVPSERGNLGLGLYIAKEIVLAHGGSLDAHSDEGTTTFVMRLPRSPPQTC